MGNTTSIDVPAPLTVDNIVLVIAGNTADAYSGSSGLNGYGIPYQALITPSNLPILNSSSHGFYGGIVTVGEPLTSDQLATIYAYQQAFGVRMVRLNVYPSASFGVVDVGATDSAQDIAISNSTGFPTARLKSAGLPMTGLYHYPAMITAANTWEVAEFLPDQTLNTSTAAVINNFDGRQQMVFFMAWATQWSQTCAFLQHAYIHWMLRGLFVGARKVYFSTQVDDIHLQTALHSPIGSTFRLRPEDLDMHVAWQADLNNRLPAGSSYNLEFAHNGNGDIFNATFTSGCTPAAITYPAVPATDLEFYKPLGSGSNVWPTSPSSYAWQCATSLASWFLNTTNRDMFSHVSHTFTHLYLNNATYDDVAKEVSFNNAWMSQLGLDQGRYSPNGLVPPAITGMHNGDAIQAWMDNGISTVVGDNSRPSLTNQQNEFWPLKSTVASNGYDGLWIMPRWPTRIYFDCDLPDCNAQQAGLSWNSLLDAERTANTRFLLSLRQDPFMFHQANLRSMDVAVSTVGSQTGQLGLLQSWVETVTQEMSRLTDWPLTTLKHDDLSIQYQNRMLRDNCSPNLSYTYSDSGKQIIGIIVTASTSCAAPIPITLPGPATSVDMALVDQVGNEPVIYWVTFNGTPITFTLATPIDV